MRTFHEFLAEKDAEFNEEYFLKKAIKHPGRCEKMGSKACPVDSPQYRLAKRLKPGGDLYKAAHGKKKKKKKED